MRRFTPSLAPLALSASLLLSMSTTLMAEPFIPKDDATVLERLPGSSVAGPELRQLRSDLAQDPENLALAVDLARRYLDIGRAEADPRWNGYAQAVLAPWWTMEEPPSGVLLLRATLKQNRHAFDEALGDLARLLLRDPRNAQAWLTRAVILQVQGHYPDSYESCRILHQLKRSLVSRACLAGVASLMGQADTSYEWLARQVDAQVGAKPEDHVWSLITLAQIAERLGRTGLAEHHYQEALEQGIRDVYLLAAYADFLLDRERPRDVLQLLGEERRSDALYLRRVLAAHQIGDADWRKHAGNLEARFASSQRRGESLHLGSEARFTLHLLGKPEQALRLALRNWEHQKEPIDARRVLEAAQAAGRPEAARPVVDWLEETGLEDVRLAAIQEMGL